MSDTPLDYLDANPVTGALLVALFTIAEVLILGVGLLLAAPVGLAGAAAIASTLATFGTAVDITVAELAIESFFPADEATAAALRER